MTTLDDILFAISGLGARIDTVGARLDTVGARFDELDTRLDKIEVRLDKIEVRLDTMDARLDAMDMRLDALEAYNKNQPDMRLMMAIIKSNMDKMIYVEGELRMLRSAINDHARENVTPGEMRALHHDLDLYRRAQTEVEIRMKRVEMVLELQPA